MTDVSDSAVGTGTSVSNVSGASEAYTEAATDEGGGVAVCVFGGRSLERGLFPRSL